VGPLWDVLATWREKSAAPVTGKALDCRHFLQEERPQDLIRWSFFGGQPNRGRIAGADQTPRVGLGEASNNTLVCPVNGGQSKSDQLLADRTTSRLVRTTTEDKLSTPRAVGVPPPANAEGQIPTQSTRTRNSAVLRRRKIWQRAVSEIARR